MMKGSAEGKDASNSTPTFFFWSKDHKVDNVCTHIPRKDVVTGMFELKNPSEVLFNSMCLDR